MSLFDVEIIEDEVNYYELIINHLNSIANTRFKPNGKAVKGWIDARLKDGFTVEDFYYVHSVKASEWVDTDYEKYLRPSTLYRPDNFQAYLSQKLTTKDKGKILSKMLSKQNINIFDVYEDESKIEVVKVLL